MINAVKCSLSKSRFSVGRFAFNLMGSATSDEYLPRIIKALLPFQYLLYFVFGNVL